MRGTLSYVFLGAALLSCEGRTQKAAPAPSCIDEKLVAGLFREMRRKGAWDLEEPLLWAYYFEAREEEPLLALRSSLEQSGYQFVELMAPERAGDRYVLRVSRVEKHTTESLNTRNRKLCALAKKMKVDAYKGMDVGPAGANLR
jgi:Regulator of ribonuclease activity B